MRFYLNKSVLVFCGIFLVIIFLAGCVEKKTAPLTEEQLSQMKITFQEKEALAEGVYSIEDFQKAEELISKGNVEERVISIKDGFECSFLVKKGRYSSPRIGKNGVVLVDAWGSANVRLFSVKPEDTLEYCKENIIRVYTRGKLGDFDKFVLWKKNGAFCPNSEEDVQVFKVKMFVFGGYRYMLVVTGKMNGERLFAVIYNYNKTDSALEDELALITKTLKFNNGSVVKK